MKHKQTFKANWLTPFLLIICSTLTSLGMVEIFFRIFIPVPPPPQTQFSKGLVHQPSPNPKLLYKLIPHASNDTGTRQSINAAGFRDREYPQKKSAETKRVIFLGDSVVYGYCIAAEDSWPKQLEQLFRQNSKKVEVLNMGVSGYDTEQEVEFLKETGLAFEPDLVILAYNLNDVIFASLGLDLLHQDSWQIKTPRPEIQKKIWGYLFSYSYLFRYLDQHWSLQQKFKKLRSYRQQKAWHYFESRNTRIQDAQDSPYRRLKPQILADGARLGTPPDVIQRELKLVGIDQEKDPLFSSHWNVSKKALLNLKALSEKHHFQVVIVIIPYLESLDRYALKSVHAFLNQELKEMGLDALDLLPEVQKINLSNGQTAFLDTGHFTPIGCQLLAKFLYQTIPWQQKFSAAKSLPKK